MPALEEDYKILRFPPCQLVKLPQNDFCKGLAAIKFLTPLSARDAVRCIEAWTENNIITNGERIALLCYFGLE